MGKERTIAWTNTGRGSSSARARRGILPERSKDAATLYSSTNEWIMPAASTIKREEREFVVDSGASMHMVRKTITLPNWRP